MITLENIHFGYSSRKPLFKDLSLKLEGGHIYGLLGKNGAGKTTLLKNMAGLRFVKAGRCETMGMDARRRLPAMLEKTYFLPEEIWLPDMHISTYETTFAPAWPCFDHAYFKACLEAFEIDPTARLKTMSFGQRKKTALAFALATKANILMLDEPTNGLDIPSKTTFRKLVAEALDEDRCIILSTHQVRDLETLIDTVIVLNDARIVLNESVDATCQRLHFSYSTTLDKPDNVLYAEMTPRGYAVITLNDGETESKVDLETLFNLCIQQPETIHHVFNA